MNKIISLIIILISYSFTIAHGQHDGHLSDSLGKVIAVTGKAANTKMGALLIMKDSTSLWIEGLDSWPKEYYLGEEKGKTLKVSGTVIEKYDLPVFIYKEGDPIKSGMPVPEGTDLKKASHRYLLKDAEWEIISE